MGAEVGVALSSSSGGGDLLPPGVHTCNDQEHVIIMLIQ